MANLDDIYQIKHILEEMPNKTSRFRDRYWSFLSVNKVFNGTDWHFRFGPKSGRSECTYRD